MCSRLISVTLTTGDLFTEGDRILIEGDDEGGIFVLYIDLHVDI